MKEQNFKLILIFCFCSFYWLNGQSFAFKTVNFEIEKHHFEREKKKNNLFLGENRTQYFDFYNFVQIQSILDEKKSYKILPMFCKMEELIYKSSKINLRINLGSNEYVRMLEGK